MNKEWNGERKGKQNASTRHTNRKNNLAKKKQNLAA